LIAIGGELGPHRTPRARSRDAIGSSSRTEDALEARGDAVSIDGLLGSLARRNIAPRIADAAEFAQENLVLLLRHDESLRG